MAITRLSSAGAGLRPAKPAAAAKPTAKPVAAPVQEEVVEEQEELLEEQEELLEEQAEDEILEGAAEEQEEEELEEELAEEAEEQQEEEPVKPTATKPVATKPAATKPVATKPAAAKPAATAKTATAAKPAAAAKPASKPAADKPAKAAVAPKAPVALGGTRPKLEIVLPEVQGTRVPVDMAHALFHRYLEEHADHLGFTVPTKAMSVKILESVFCFLLGDTSEELADVNPDTLARNGGLARYFEVKLREGVHFKHQLLDGRVYPNPRRDAANPDEHIMVTGRRFVRMNTVVQDGQSVLGVYNKDSKEFTPYE